MVPEIGRVCIAFLFNFYEIIIVGRTPIKVTSPTKSMSLKFLPICGSFKNVNDGLQNMVKCFHRTAIIHSCH